MVEHEGMTYTKVETPDSWTQLKKHLFDQVPTQKWTRQYKYKTATYYCYSTSDLLGTVLNRSISKDFFRHCFPHSPLRKRRPGFGFMPFISAHAPWVEGNTGASHTWYPETVKEGFHVHIIAGHQGLELTFCVQVGKEQGWSAQLFLALLFQGRE